MPDDAERLRSAFARGELLHPVSATPSLVDLARALAMRADVPDVEVSPAALELRDAVGPAEHLLLVLVDGLGLVHLQTEARAPFLREHLVRTLLTPFPSTTAVALTSLATGAWPARHSITGWWSYIPSIGATVTALPFTRRIDDKALELLGVTAEDAFPVPSMWGACPRDVLCVQPSRIAGTTYSVYQTGGHAAAGYGPIREAFELTWRHVEQADGPTFTYLYFPQFDAAAHDRGVLSVEAQGALGAIDEGLRELVGRFAGRVRTVVTSDHGHAFVPEERRHRLRSGDALASMLRDLPSGDMRAPSFHVRPESREAFAEGFRTRFGHSFVLLTPDDVEELRLLGPDPLTEETRARLGDFVGVSLGIDVFGYVTADGNRRALQQPSHHSGLTALDMQIPLILA